jgi:hypothetical protein
MEPTTIQLTGLSANDVTTLAEAGVTNSTELMSLTHEDVCAIIPTSSFLKKWKVSNVAKYFASGQNINVNTTMADILRYLSERANLAPIQLPPLPADEPVNLDWNHRYYGCSRAVVQESKTSTLLQPMRSPSAIMEFLRPKNCVRIVVLTVLTAMGSLDFAMQYDESHRLWRRRKALATIHFQVLGAVGLPKAKE